jgi:osmoprotectant transport system substrate-binding protein
MDRAKAFACLIAALLPAGCSTSRSITVGSKNFTEQVILGEIISQHIEKRLNRKVNRKLNLGGTLLAHEALVKGEIDLYPEYTGTALTAILKQPPSASPAAVFEQVRGQYRSRWHIDWLQPLDFNNTFAIIIRGKDARDQKIETISDAVRFSQGWVMGVGYEFQQRPDGLAGLLKTYPLRLHGAPRTMDLGLLYRALEQNQVSMVAGNATDGLLSVLDVKVLQDDKHYFPPYQPAIVVREEALAANPGLRPALDRLSGKFSDAVMRKLNYEVDGEHRSPAEVAARFLQESAIDP